MFCSHIFILFVCGVLVLLLGIRYAVLSLGRDMVDFAGRNGMPVNNDSDASRLWGAYFSEIGKHKYISDRDGVGIMYGDNDVWNELRDYFTEYYYKLKNFQLYVAAGYEGDKGFDEVKEDMCRDSQNYKRLAEVNDHLSGKVQDLENQLLACLGVKRAHKNVIDNKEDLEKYYEGKFVKLTEKLKMLELQNESLRNLNEKLTHKLNVLETIDHQDFKRFISNKTEDVIDKVLSDSDCGTKYNILYNKYTKEKRANAKYIYRSVLIFVIFLISVIFGRKIVELLRLLYVKVVGLVPIFKEWFKRIHDVTVTKVD